MHHFKYNLKTLFRNKMLIFWTFAFPIILGTFFYMAFSNIEQSEKLDCIPIAIIDNDAWQENVIYQETFQTLEKEEQVFKITYTNEETAKELLESDKIDGYLKIEETPKVVIQKNGVNQTVFKQVMEEIVETEEMLKSAIEMQINHAIKNNEPIVDRNLYLSNIKNNILETIKTYESNLLDTSRKHLSYTMIEYYTLIAMACLYGGILGMVAINKNLANMGTHGKRVSIAPIKKGKLVITSALAAFLTQMIGVVLLFLYTIFILKVDYGEHLVQIILLAMFGCFAGLTLGIAVASIFKTNENTKLGIILSVTMLGCFLSGMMGITMKYVVDKNFSLLNKMNPANMITDGFYALYYYDTFNRYYFNLCSLILFSMIMLILAIIHLRRQTYDSI